MLVFLKSQQALFETQVRVDAHVKKDGTVVAPYSRKQKKALEQPAAQPSKLEQFIARHGGHQGLAGKLAMLTAAQQDVLYEQMAKLDGRRVDEIRQAFDVKPRELKRGESGDLFAPAVAPPAPASTPAADEARAPEQLEQPVAPEPAPAEPEPAGTTVVRKKRVRADIVNQEGPHTIVDLSDGSTHRIERIGSAESMGVPGWHGPDGYLADTEEAAAAELAKRQKPAPAIQSKSNHTPFGVQPGIGKAERRQLNARAAALVAEKTPGEMTAADRDVLRQYSGNGGCGDSLNEFYTPADVAASMWQVATRIGAGSGTCLEPSCGTGVFLHTAPAGFKVTGVEMDPVSSDVAKALHGDRHEIRGSVSLERFATSDGGRQFDVVLGNPPFGPRGSLVKDDKPELKTAETYFVDTAIDKAKAGGIVGLVLPAGIMDSKNGRRFRERVLRKAEFLGAQRMPNTAFEASHTDVTTDVVWLRRRPDDVAGALMTVDKAAMEKLGVWDDEFLAGTYFAGRGAGNVFGQVGTAMRAFGEVYTVNGSMAGVAQHLAEFEPDSHSQQPTVPEIVAALAGDEAAQRKAMGGALVRPYGDAKVGDTKTVDGVEYVLQGRPPRWHRVDEIMSHEAVADAKPLAEEIDRAMSGQDVDRTRLADDIRAYIARHGLPVKSRQLVQAADQNPLYHRLIGAVDRQGRLSDVILGKRTAATGGSIESAAATLAAERDNGAFSVDDVADRAGRDADAVEETLLASPAYAYLGDGLGWMPMESYLTGELWPKLDAAKLMLAAEQRPGYQARLAEQVKRLDETIEPRSLEDVDFGLNTGFIPTAVLKAWMDSRVAAMREGSPGSTYYQDLPEAQVEFKDSFYTISGGEWGLADTLSKYLNRTGIRQDDMPKVERMNDEFRTWVMQSPYRDEVEALYNRKFRGFVAPGFSKTPIDIPGLDTAGGAREPNDYHWDSLRWALKEGKGIVADDVGLGKTLRGLMLMRLAKLNGQAQKPVCVVPKSVLANWLAEVEVWFPGSRVMVIGETYSRGKDGELRSKPDNETERNRKYHDLTQNDYDFVFIGRDSFNELDVDPIVKGTYLEQDFWVQRGDKLGNAGDKQVKRVRENYKQAVADREFGKRTDAIYFNDLGIDMLVIDEAHAYKNLYAARARFGESPKFLGGQGQSNRAFDMSFKAKWLREQTGGKGVYGLTATPTKNSPLEIYSMLSYIAPDAFENVGVRNSEEFLDRYCVFTRENVLGTNGEIDEALVTSGFKNLGELRQIMDRYIMRRKASDVGLTIPAAQQELHMVDMTAQQQTIYGELRELLAESGKKDATGDAHVFSIMDKMGKAALDPTLLGHAGAEAPKFAELAAKVKAGAADGGQIVFCESIDSHDRIAAAIEAAGIPRSRIAVMNAQVASSSAQRQNLSDKFNRGELDVVIGNKVMEEGVNLQKRTADIHHLDTPWDPATLQQRNGRGVRQGNRNAAVRLHAYLSKGSFDGYRYQSMSAKRDWMDLLWSGGDRVENLAREGKFSREDMAVMMSADPEAERAKLASDKVAATQRLTAERTGKAVEQFVRFQELRRNLDGLKNKDSASARRLQQQVDRARTGLRDNKYFHAKSALDSNDDVLLNPSNGHAIAKDMGFEVKEEEGAASKWVVTGVDSKRNTVSMRMYANTSGHKGVTVSVDKFKGGGIQPFALDKDAEAAEVRATLESQANENLKTLSKYEDVLKMPSAVLAANHDLLQEKIRAGLKGYSFHFPYGKIPLVNRETGAPVMAESYEARKLADTHDVFLPTDDNVQRAIQAWKDTERDAEIERSYSSIGKGRSQKSITRVKRKYPGTGHNDKNANPFSELLNTIGGKPASYGGDGPMVAEARKALHVEQLAKVRRAKTTAEMYRAALPLAKVNDSDPDLSDKMAVTFTPDVLSMLWARAATNGDMDRKVDEVFGREAGIVFKTVDGRAKTVRRALLDQARGTGQQRLALSMLRNADRMHPQRDARQAYDEALPKWVHDEHAPEMLRMAKKHAERGGFINEKRVARAGTAYYHGGTESNGEWLDKQIAEANEHAARRDAKEAA